MYLIQIILPAPSGSGDADAFSKTREELADKFGGVTAYTRAAAQGLWVAPDGEKERDSVIMIEVLAQAFDRAWWRAYQEQLAARFHQEEIHVRALDAQVP